MENKRLIISVGSPVNGGAVDSVFGRTGNVIAVNGDYTTSLVTESTDKKYVTDAEKTVLSNTSGTNTGDETTSTIQTKRPLNNVNGESLEGTGDIDINKSDVGLGNVDNTSDLDKPISTATQTALDDKLESIPNAAYNVVGGIKISRDSASSTTYISFDGSDVPNVT